MRKLILAFIALALTLPATDALAKRKHVYINKPSPRGDAPPPTPDWKPQTLIVVPPAAVAFDIARRTSCDPTINRAYGKADPGYPESGGAKYGNFLIPAIY